MVVGIMKIELHLHDNRSLKGKRKVVKSMVGKVKHRFNVAIAETGSNDKWQKIELGVSTVGNDRRHVDSSLTNVLSFIDSLYLAEIVDSKIEILNI
ncbi:MAG: DUF503 domain-containing protein [Deltaproteobacteria bacterium]|nr:DUF503 domain-containing protein [Deltaproteobacteria bacterium]